MKKYWQKITMAWRAGGILSFLAVYAVVSPIVVVTLTSSKLAGRFAFVPWWIVPTLVVVGHLNTLVLMPSLFAWRRWGRNWMAHRADIESSS